MEKALKIALTAIGVRLVFAPFFAHVWDMNTLQISLEQFLNGIDPYTFMAQQSALLSSRSGFPVSFEGYDYLPQPLLIFVPFYELYRFLGGNPAPILNVTDITTQIQTVNFSSDINFFLTVLKLPIIIADASVTYLLARSDYTAGRAYAFSPYAILISAVWGQFDAFVALFLLLSIVFLDRNNTFLPGFFYGLSLMKVYTVVFLPFYAARTWKKARFSGVMNLVFGIGVAQIPTFYFLHLDPVSMIQDILTFNGTRPSGGVTPLYVLSLIPDVQTAEYGKILALGVLAAFYILTLYAITRARLDFVESLICTFGVFLMFSTVVNEQYLVAILPLLFLRTARFATRLSIVALVFALLNSTPVYFAMPLLYELRLFSFVKNFFDFLAMPPVLATQSTLLFLLGITFFLTNFDLIRSVLARQLSPSRIPDSTVWAEKILVPQNGS